MVNKTIYYYLILLSNFLFSIGIAIIAYFISLSKITSNISFIPFILFIISYMILMYISFKRKYFTHFLIYFIGLISTFYIIYLKKNNE